MMTLERDLWVSLRNQIIYLSQTSHRIINVNCVNGAGLHATVIRVGSEAQRKDITDESRGLR